MKTLLLALILAGVVYGAVMLGSAAFVVAAFGAFIGLGAAALSIVAAAMAAVLGVIVGLAAIVLGLIVALAPLWMPALAIVGIVALCRRHPRA